MSGKRIDDRSSWISSNGTVFPMGCKEKDMSGVEGAGELNRYADTAETINSQQRKSVSKAKSLPMKEDYRQ